jgi:transcriptional activator SPT7
LGGEEDFGTCRVSGSVPSLRIHRGRADVRATFTGTSEVALDVLAGVTSEYLLNVGRTMRFLCDKYAQKMTPEVHPPTTDILVLSAYLRQEIILHALFESGTSKIQNLERYIKDDVIRHGSRLADLEKKLVGAYDNLVSSLV